MRIEKIINNNLVRSFNDKGVEIIVMGCGIGFKQEVGSLIDEQKIEKIYTLNDKYLDHLEKILERIPLKHLKITNEIIDYANISLKRKLSTNIYLSLCEHLNFAIKRAKQGINLINPLNNEIKRFYHNEYSIGLFAIKLIKKELKVNLIEDEAAYIAMHLISNILDLNDVSKAQEISNIIKEIVNIVRFHFALHLDDKSIHYERFITHLKFFVRRLFDDKKEVEYDKKFFLMIKRQYKEAYKCVLKISDYLLKSYNLTASEEEMMYLCVHINRISNNIRKE